MANAELEVAIAGEVPLEGVLHLPEGEAPRAGAVVCHPHPLYGGNMHNAVVVAVAREATRRGLATLRFNFRGTGGSGGRHGDGRAEVADVGAALSFLAERIGPEAPLGLAGYSFGAAVAAAYTAGGASGGNPAARALALVALPVGMLHPDWPDLAALRGRGLPILAVAGEDDEVAEPAALRERLAPLGETAVLVTVPGADHSFAGHRGEVGRAVAAFFAWSLADRR